MELYQIKTFDTVARTGSVTRAAEILNTTPPSVSNHIRQLEEALGVCLFTRTPKGMQITSHGRLLLDKAKAVLQGVEHLESAAAGLQSAPRGSVRFGINADPAMLKIPDIISAVNKSYPDIRLEIVPSYTDQINDYITRGKMDCGFAFGPQEENGRTFTYLSPVELIITIPSAFQKTHQTAPLRRIAQLPWIVPENSCPFMRQVITFLKEKGIVLEKRIFANDDITKLTLVGQGKAVCVLARQEAQGFIDNGTACAWEGPQSFESSLWFSYLKNREEDAVIKAIKASVTSVWTG